MADVLHVAKLREGVAAWNAWREANPDIVPDLRGLTLSLSQRQMGLAQGGPVNLRDAQLGGADLRFATLTGADLSNSGLAAADLGAALLQQTNFSGADLTGAVFGTANLSGAFFDGAALSGARFAQAAGLMEEQLQRALGDMTTALPEGLAYPDSWLSSEMANEPPVNSGSGQSPQQRAPDLYTFIGVPRTANEKAIRDAYRATAKSFHPDRRPGDPAAEEAFKLVTAAADILLDKRSRALYDEGAIDVYGNATLQPPAKRSAGLEIIAAVLVFMAVLAVTGWVFFLQTSPQAEVSAEHVRQAASPENNLVVATNPEIAIAATEFASEDAIKAPPEEKAVQTRPAMEPVAEVAPVPEHIAETIEDKPVAPLVDAPVVLTPPLQSHPLKNDALAHAVHRREGRETSAKVSKIHPARATRRQSSYPKASLEKPTEEGVSYHEVNLQGWPGGCVVKMTPACKQGKAWCGC